MQFLLSRIAKAERIDREKQREYRERERERERHRVKEKIKLDAQTDVARTVLHKQKFHWKFIK